MSPGTSHFDFHGVVVRLTSDDGEVRDRVEKDFRFFLMPPEASPHAVALSIDVRRTDPGHERIPARRASVYTPRNICYDDGPRTWIDYFGRALAVYDREAGSVEARGLDVHLLTEIVYLTILSRVGERLEDAGLHRVHALGLELGGEAALFLMPSGCGKTTLALSVLRRPLPIRVSSEDSPLVDVEGRVHPFPLRIGVLGAVPEGIPPEHVSVQRRMEFAPKSLIALDAFPGRLSPDVARPRFVFLGHRHTSPGCRLVPATRGAIWKGLARHMVVGAGLYQGVEFLLQTSLRDLVRQRRRLTGRVRAARALVRGSEVFELDLGPDPERNADEVLKLLDERGFGR